MAAPLGRAPPLQGGALKAPRGVIFRFTSRLGLAAASAETDIACETSWNAASAAALQILADPRSTWTAGEWPVLGPSAHPGLLLASCVLESVRGR